VLIGHTLKPKKPTFARNLIGARLREVRRCARPRISQEDLCGRIARYGVVLTRTQVAKIESGRRPVSDYEAVALAVALKLAPADLLPSRAQFLAR